MLSYDIFPADPQTAHTYRENSIRYNLLGRISVPLHSFCSVKPCTFDLLACKFHNSQIETEHVYRECPSLSHCSSCPAKRTDTAAVCMHCTLDTRNYVKGKVFPYSLQSVGPGTDPGVHAFSPQVT